MKGVFLGTGVSVVTKRRGSSALLIETVRDRVLFDCGPGTARMLQLAGYRVSILENIFLTHFHIDHVLDYATIVSDRALTTRGHLSVFGPRGLQRHTKMLFRELFPDLARSLRCFDFLTVEEVKEGIVAQADDWEVACAPTKHSGGIAYRMTSGGKSLLYSGDTSPCESLVELGKGVDLAVMECSFPDSTLLTGNHLHPRSAAQLASKMGAKRLIFTHLYPACNAMEDTILKEAKKEFGGEVQIAEDGMRFSV